MKIKHSHRKSLANIIVEQLRQDKTKGFIAILLYTFLVFALGYYIHRAGFSFVTSLKTQIRANIYYMPKKILNILARPETEHLFIDIKHEDYMQLAYKREVALRQKMLITEESSFVPATIRHNDELIRVKIRLKGDFIDHLQKDKWSFRIVVKGDKTLLRMKEFSLQHPETRNYIYEWIYHQALKREGLLSIRYQFIHVTLNGKDLGVYALEENFEKRLIENNGLREGPIIRFNESLAWEENRRRIWNGMGGFQSSDIDAFQTNKLLSDRSKYSQFIKAKNLLESFRRGDLSTGEAFDIEKLARYYAITDLMGDKHGNRWTNVRFYYNPTTSRLEPIGYDADPGRRLKSLSFTRIRWSTLNQWVFKDGEFFIKYVKELDRVSRRSYLDSLFTDIQNELDQNLNIIYSEFPSFHFSKEVLYKNQNFIHETLNPVKGLQAYFEKSTENQFKLEVGNIQYMPIEVLSASYKDTVQFQLRREVVIRRALFDTQPVDYQSAYFVFPDNFEWSAELIKDLKVNYRILGTNCILQAAVIPWSHLDKNFTKNDFIRQKPNAHTFRFLTINSSTQEILLKPGDWEVDRSLIIPKGYKVVARENTCLNLLNSAKILSYSPLEFIGSEDHPIIMQAQDSLGQGIVVMNASQASTLEYVIFRNLSNPSHSGWELTGAVTFYESPVHLSHTQFLGNRSEDALHIVRSEFTLDKTLFNKTRFDAFDADFSKGSITNSSFVAVGNDAIDVSGSVVEIQDVFINGAGDKGLSVGEISRLTANSIDIKNAAIAVASKDLSNTSIRGINISDCAIGLAGYQKKSEFGPASMEVHGLDMSTVNTPYLVEAQSSVVVDNKVIEFSRENIREILLGLE